MCQISFLSVLYYIIIAVSHKIIHSSKFCTYALLFKLPKPFLQSNQRLVKLFVLVHGFKLFTEEFFQIPMEKTNEKITSGTKATEDVGSHCYGLLQRQLNES